jgi:acetyl esterase/lipase
MKPTPPLDEIVRMRIVHRVPGTDRVHVDRDRPYKKVSGGALLADVYRPTDAAAPCPTVVLIHGGPVPAGSAPKNMGCFVSWGETLAASGLAAVTFNHRFHGGAQLLEAARDVEDAVAWVRNEAGELGIDSTRLALWAFSGGGPFLSLALREGGPAPRALVAYYAALDLREMPPDPTAPISDADRLALSPAHHVESGRGVPPVLVARAGLDHPLLNATIDRFITATLANNAPLEAINHPDGRHGFDILDDDPRSREIAARTIEFLRAHLT